MIKRLINAFKVLMGKERTASEVEAEARWNRFAPWIKEEM